MDHSYLGPARDAFTEAYVNAAILDTADRCGIAEDCGEDCNGSHAPIALAVSDLSPATLERLETDAGEFFDAHMSDLALFPGDHFHGADQWAETGGANFWWTRAGHGSGFGDWYEQGRHPQDAEMIAARDRLSTAAGTEGERDLFRGTDDKITHGKSWGEIQRERNGS